MNISSTSCRTVVVAALAGLLGSVSALRLPLPARAQDAAPPSQAEAIPKKPRGAEIVIHGGYPELHVAGEPFFIHSAAFFYDRIPRDLWNPALDRYRNLGINTIDLYIPWNWHEPREGQFDFEGKTNARRDLRGLLRLIAAKNLKLIARPGPLILNEWRLGGYPEWLLTRPDYPAADKMDEIDLFEGRYPPLAALNTRDAEAAAEGWLGNPTHMAYARKWLEAVARELAPYSAASAGTGNSPAKLTPEGANVESIAPFNKPLLFVQLDDDAAGGRANTVGPNFWRYMESLREMLRAGGLDAPVFVNPTDMRVPASGAALEHPIAVMGQWYLHTSAHADELEQQFTTQDAATIEFFTEKLKTQPAFPPALIEYQAGWYAPGDDDRPIDSPPANTLESSRLFLAYGLHGISYFPLQDTVTPAGESVPWVNRAYLWGAAFDPDAHRQRRADAVQRNADFLKQWGPQLAASHERADFGLVDPLGAYAEASLTPEDVRRVSDALLKIERLAQLVHVSSELLDPENQPGEQLRRDALLFLPVFDSAGVPLPLSEKAQHNLVEYVRAGGTLLIFPTRPPGAIIGELWSQAPAGSNAPADIVSATWKFGSGRVIESSKDFFSWVNLNAGFDENRAQESAAFSIHAFGSLLQEAGIHPAVIVTGNPAYASDLVVTELVSNDGGEPLGIRSGGTGWLSVTNLNSDDSLDAPLEILPPAASSTGNIPQRTLLTVTIPPKESLLLPLNIPICSEVADLASCKDAVVTSGAEYLGAVREGKSLELSFYAPARAGVRLHLDHQPTRATMQDSTVEAGWDQSKQELSFSIPRGASPQFLRVLKVQLPYVPHAPQLAHEPEHAPGEFELAVTNAVRLPLGPSANVTPFPPLVVVNDPRNVRVVFEASNPSREHPGDLTLNITGPYRGTTDLRIVAGQIGVADATLKPAPNSNAAVPSVPDIDGLLHGDIELHEGKIRDHSPIAFITLKDSGVTAYRCDFDGDGEKEWVLENSGLRLIVSPASGGRALALVDKATSFDVFSSVGALRDNFSYTPNPPDVSPERARGRYGLFNRGYAADWIADGKNTALHLRYRAPDIYPHGAEVEKTIELDGGDSMHIDYRVALSAPSDSPAAKDAEPSANANEPPPQSFVAVQSIPAIAEGSRITRLCWNERHPAEAPANPPASGIMKKGQTATTESAAAPQTSGQTHCENFAPGGAIVEVPIDAKHLELRAPGRPGLALDWESGRMSVEPKRFSVLLRLTFPSLAAGAEMKSTLRFHVLPAE
ncbi:MAG: beta-galactosidase [Candidatus Acidiferrales bacterium]